MKNLDENLSKTHTWPRQNSQKITQFPDITHNHKPCALHWRPAVHTTDTRTRVHPTHYRAQMPMWFGQQPALNFKWIPGKSRRHEGTGIYGFSGILARKVEKDEKCLSTAKPKRTFTAFLLYKILVPLAFAPHLLRFITDSVDIGIGTTHT